jgi:hypothetical protein
MIFGVGDEVLLTFPTGERDVPVYRHIGVYRYGYAARGKVTRSWVWRNHYDGENADVLLFRVKFDENLEWDCHPDWLQPIGGPW